MAKTHLRIATAPGHPDDADVQEKLDAAEAAILRYVERSPAGAALVAQWVTDLDAPADLRAAVLLQLGELWRFRGDDPATLALSPARDAGDRLRAGRARPLAPLWRSGARMMPAGLRDKRVTLDAPGAPVADADGGFLDAYTPLDPPDAFAAIVPVTARDQERAFAGTVLATATHEITVPYHPGVTIETRVTYVDPRSGRTRALQVTALRDPDEARAGAGADVRGAAAMSNRLTFVGLDQLRAGPAAAAGRSCATRPPTIIHATATGALEEMRAAYPEGPRGGLKRGLKVTLRDDASSAPRASSRTRRRMRSSSRRARRRATSRRLPLGRAKNFGYRRGAMPPGRVFIPIAMRRRRAMYAGADRRRAARGLPGDGPCRIVPRSMRRIVAKLAGDATLMALVARRRLLRPGAGGLVRRSCWWRTWRT